MKNHLGFNAVILISLSMFTWSGWIYAADPKIEDAWTREDPGRSWTVVEAHGGHMEVGDTFTISQSTTNTEVKLSPDQDLKGRWNLRINEVNLTKETFGSNNFLCGFVELDTKEHERGDEGFTPFGHGKLHGFLIKVKTKKRLIIIWPAGKPNEASTVSERCEELEKRSRDNHGGMAHAKG